MKIQFTLYAGNKEHTKVMEFADTADESEIEQAFDDWRAGLFYSFWEQCDER